MHPPDFASQYSVVMRSYFDQRIEVDPFPHASPPFASTPASWTRLCLNFNLIVLSFYRLTKNVWIPDCRHIQSVQGAWKESHDLVEGHRPEVWFQEFYKENQWKPRHSNQWNSWSCQIDCFEGRVSIWRQFLSQTWLYPLNFILPLFSMNDAHFHSLKSCVQAA